MSKSVFLIKNKNLQKSMEFDHIQTPGSSQSSEDTMEKRESKKEAKKPSKTTRRQRVNQFIHKINEDTLDQVVKDILEENVRLRKEIESLRVQNVSLKREHEELIHALLQDRLKNQNSDLEF